MLFFQHAKPFAKITAFGALLASLLFSGVTQAEYRLNFQDPVTKIAEEIYDLHMLIFWICVVIFVVVFGVMFYSIFKHRKSKNYEPAQFSHSTSVEIIWTVIPFFILVAMAIPATKVLIKMEDTTKSDLTIKITGYQWKWGYEYLDSDISFYSTLSTPREQIDQFDRSTAVEQGENYLLEVDNHVIVPSGRKVRALITANDVIHAWWIPAFGAKKDAIPGYINELWFNVEKGKEGLYRGQCAELCGKDHAFMPIVVEVVTGEQFDSWVASGGTTLETNSLVERKVEEQEQDQQPESVIQVLEAPDNLSTSRFETGPSQTPAEKVLDAIVPVAQASDTVAMTKEELMSQGADVASKCLACHGVDGKGIPGVFPSIAGSAVATGAIEDHIDIVMYGKAGTAMVAFAGQLSDKEIAAIVTYQRNSYGNDTGDLVQPSDIAAKRN